MADQENQNFSESELNAAFQAAIAVAGAPPMGDPQGEMRWSNTVKRLAPKMLVLASDVFARLEPLRSGYRIPGICLGATEHSNRGVVGLMATNKDGAGLSPQQARDKWLELRRGGAGEREQMKELGIEEFRTEWLNTPEGKGLKEDADAFFGKRVLVFKYMEPMTGEQNKGREVRMVGHLQLLPDRNDQNDDTGSDSAPVSAPAPQEAAPAPAQETPAAAPSDDRRTKLHALTPQTSVDTLGLAQEHFSLSADDAKSRLGAVAKRLEEAGTIEHKRGPAECQVIWKTLVDDMLVPAS